ncbi:MAG: formyltransferase family protein [Bacteroidota bacterium]
MRIFLVIDETRFYHPDFVAEFLRKTDCEVVGAALVQKVHPKNDLQKYIIRNWYRLRLKEMFVLGVRKVWYAVKDRFQDPTTSGSFYSVASVFKHFEINWFPVSYTINQAEHLSAIAALKPDVIISSNPLYFGKRLLKIPKIACINRHSALLPKYGGVWPVFQAVRSGEKFTGVAVHTMVPKIDRGVVLAQAAIPIQEGDSLSHLYKQCFAASAEVLLAALEKIKANDYSPANESDEVSYFTFPTAEQWKEFRARGGTFV